jgi:tetratricopeptide (TPR) repeat protein
MSRSRKNEFPSAERNRRQGVRTAGGTSALATTLQSEHLRSWLPAVALIVAVFFAYQPAWHGGFVWDDDLHLLNNPVIRLPDGLARAWTSADYINYWPLTFTVYRLEYDLWGLNSLGYHLVNIALHALSALLVWRILEHLRIPGAMLAAAIFALHPVNVESVAWIAQLKNVLSLPLVLLSVLFFLRHDRDGRWWQLAASVGFFLLSALAKGIGLTLPVVLLACVCWQHGRIGRRDLLRVVPYMLIAALMVWVEVGKQHAGIGDNVVRSDGLLGRAAVAGCAVWFYFWKVIWPANLIFVYPRWNISERDLWAYLPGVLLVVILVVAWWRRGSWGRPVVMLMVCYVALLLPVLGFADIVFMKYSLVADHWQYAAMIVPCAAMAALFTMLLQRAAAQPLVVSQASPTNTPLKNLSRRQHWLSYCSYGLSLFLLAILATLTFYQSRMYANIETLYRTILDRNPDCWLVQNNLGDLLSDEGQFLMQRGQTGKATALYKEAIAHFRNALTAKPDYAEAHLNLGNALAGLGRPDEAIGEFREALGHKHDFINAYVGLGRALVLQGRFAEAISCYHDARKVDSDDLPTLNELAWLRATCCEAAFRDGGEAVSLAEHASVLSKGHNPTVLDTLAAAYAEAGRFSDAIQVGDQALDLARRQGNAPLVERITARQRLYMAETPYHQPSPASPVPTPDRMNEK